MTALRIRRRGFTVVELVVAVLIGVNVLLILWTVFSADQRRFFGDQARLTALQGALLFEGRLADDLDRLATRVPDTTIPPDPSSPRFDMNQPVIVDNQNSRLTFLRYKEDPTPGSAPVEQVEYAFVPGSSQVTRTVEGTAQTLGNVLAEDLRFSYVLLQVTPEKLGTPPPGLYNTDVPLAFLKFQITCFSEALRDRGEERRKAEERITLNGALPLKVRTATVQHPYWKPAGFELMAP